MKFVMCKSSILALALFIAAPLVADSDCRECEPVCCAYTCSEIPLACGAFDLQVHGGVEPILWANRGYISTIQCTNVAGANPVVQFFRNPRFFKLFHVPWTIGGQVGYALNDNIRTYVEFNYQQASGKGAANLLTLQSPASTVVFDMSKYKLYDAYLGFQYFFDRWCDRYSVFLGAKVGVMHHQRTKFSATIAIPPAAAVAFITDQYFFNSNTKVSGGLSIGLDVCMCNCWSLMIVGELVANCGPKSGDTLAFGQNVGCNPPALTVPGINNFLFGSIGTELRFPITVGARYTF
jgi:hypothetical protein